MPIVEKRFPIQSEGRRQGDGKVVQLPRLFIPWSVAEEAYAVYANRFGTSQSLERLAERGGFGRDELLWLLSGAEGVAP